MELVQSFIFSVARAEVTSVEQRVIVQIVKFAQIIVNGKLIKNHLGPLEIPDNVKVTLNLSECLPPGSHHQDEVLKALEALSRKQMKCWDSRREMWFCSPLIYNIVYRAGSGVATIYVSKTVFSTIVDFTKGFSRYNLEKCLSLRSPYSMRLYALLGSQRKPLVFAIRTLYEIFECGDKYRQTADFIKRVIMPAQNELSENSANGFTFEPVFQGRKIVSLRFFPVRREPLQESQTLAMLPEDALLINEIKVVLMQEFGFSSRELSAHKVLLNRFSRLPFYAEKLLEILHRYRKNGYKKGYVINAIKGEVTAFFGPVK